jgi:carbamoyl-phosphate synthase small subunit
VEFKAMTTSNSQGRILLEDGTALDGNMFGSMNSAAGEVVFNTGMVGYPEALTDPSYKGQILVFTYPLIGNYGIPAKMMGTEIDPYFESDRIQVAGLIVAEAAPKHNHWNSSKSLASWLVEDDVPAISGIDTRALTKKLRHKGSMLGKILTPNGDQRPFYDPNRDLLVDQVSIEEPRRYGDGDKTIILIDCGCKLNIIRSLVAQAVTVVRVPWDYDFSDEKYDAVVISNGPGDPEKCRPTIASIQKAFAKEKPILGICLGNQLLALAAGAGTYKMKFGHRSQNQPCIEVGSQRCYITSQNHGFAVDNATIPSDWQPWFVNANDGTNEGLKHKSKPYFGVQFHPEATPGPVDTRHIFSRFLSAVA